MLSFVQSRALELDEAAGRAGERLHWKFGTGEAVPLEEWVTYGNDDVRRAATGDGAGFVAEGAAELGWIVACHGAVA